MSRREFAIMAAIALCVGLSLCAIYYDLAHPCVVEVNCRQEPYTWFMHVGDVMVPMSSERRVCDCLERAP